MEQRVDVGDGGKRERHQRRFINVVRKDMEMVVVTAEEAQTRMCSSKKLIYVGKYLGLFYLTSEQHYR